MTEDRSNEPENRLIEFIYSEQQKENKMKKLTESWGTCGTTTKEVTFYLQISERKAKEHATEKVFN